MMTEERLEGCGREPRKPGLEELTERGQTRGGFIPAKETDLSQPWAETQRAESRRLHVPGFPRPLPPGAPRAALRAPGSDTGSCSPRKPPEPWCRVFIGAPLHTRLTVHVADLSPSRGQADRP